MHRAQLEWRTLKLVEAVGGPDVFDHPDIRDAVNEAYLDVLRMRPWPFLNVDETLTLADGTAGYSLPAPVDSVTRVEVDGHLLRPWSETAAAAYGAEPDPEDAARPERYALPDPSRIEFWPTPDSAYTAAIAGRRALVELADGESPVFDDEHHPVVCYMAASNLLTRSPEEKAGELADRYQKRAGEKLEAMRVHYLVDHSEVPSVMGGRRDRNRRPGRPPAGRLWT